MKKLSLLIFSLLLIIAIICSLSSCNPTISIENRVSNLLQNDLDDSVNITKLYYNKEKQGCFVEFRTRTYSDKSAIDLNTNTIEYESEFDYWSTKAKNSINEYELHKYNQNIINSFYADWHFSVTLFEANGRPKDSDWKRIK